MSIQTKVGWRPYVNLTSVQAGAYLLDSYSGAAAAYSLRKLKSSYTGSAIRVRRSSDNTELNIGFDSDGNLDTYALSSFVGTGNGFVTTWYDQSGIYNLIQTTAANQPSIVLSGAINTQNGKPILITDYNSYMINNSVSINGTTNSIFATIKMVTTRGNIAIMAGYGNENQHFVSRNINGNGRYYDSGGQEITAAVLPNGLNLIGIHENSSGITVYENGANLVTNFAHSVNNTTGIVIFRRDVQDGCYMQSGSGFAELIVYGNSSKLSDNSGISTNINSYYSVYPNPTSVWNLLAAAYNADTTASSSLKTSLFAAYNGESNANDSFGANNGTAVGGLTYTTGKIGNAFQFNGTNAYVSLPNSSGQFNFTGDFSVSMWFKSSNLSTSRYAIGNYKSGGSNGYGWQLYYSVVGGFAFDLRNGNNINQVRKIQTINTNTWYHVVGVRKMGQIHKLYVNGVDVSAPQTDGNVNNIAGYIANQPMDLGGLSDANAPALCDLDGVNIWQKPLTASEITELYNSGNGAQYITDSFYKPTTNDALNTNNGTAQGGLTYGVGKVGTAFQFNGTNAYVSLPDNSLKSILTGDFSISCWFYPVDTTNTWRTIINCYSGSGDAPHQGFELSVVGGVEPMFGIYNGYSNSELRRANTFTMNQWNHVVVTRKNGVGSKLYHNGSLVTSNTNTLNPGVSTTMSSSIGAFKFGGSISQYQANGNKIDSLNVWSKELSASEITELYNSGNGKQYPN